MAVGGFDNIVSTSVKTVYPQQEIAPQINAETPFRRALKKELPSGARYTDGGVVNFGMNLAPPQNYGVIADLAAMKAPVERSDKLLTLKPALFHGTFQIGWVTKRAAVTKVAAFNKGELRRRTEETLEDLAKGIERTYLGTHGTMRLGTVSADGSNTLTMAKPEWTTLVRENMMVTLRQTDGGTVRDSLDNRKITKVDHDTGIITYDGADQTATAADHLHLTVGASQGTLSAADAGGICPNGLRGLIDDGTNLATVHNVDRTAAGNHKLKALVKSAGGVTRNLTERILINACHEVRQRSGKRVTDIWCNTGQIEKYIDFVAPDRRFPAQGGKLPAYRTGYTEDSLVHVAPGIEMKINIGWDVIPREMYLLNWDTFFHYISQDVDWWDEGNMLKPVPTDGGYKAGFFAALASIENIGCTMFIANLVIRDLKDPLVAD